MFIATRWVEGTELGTLIRRDGPLEPRPGGADRRADRRGAGGGPREGADPPRRQALQRDRHLGGPRLPDRLRPHQAGRHRPRGFTVAAQMLGTIDYVAPEQIEGNEADTRGDVYGLACVLYEMLIGAPPFAGETGGMAKMWAHLNAEPPSVREHRARRAPRTGRRDPARPGQAPDDRPSAAAFGAEVLAAVGEIPRAARHGPRVVARGAQRLETLRSLASLGEPGRPRAVERVRGQHDAAERDPRGAVVGGRSACRASRRRPAAVARAGLAGGVGRPGGGHEHHGCCVPPAGLPDRSCSTGMSAGLRPSKAGHAWAAIRRPAGSGSSAIRTSVRAASKPNSGVAVGLAGRPGRHRLVCP